MASTADELTAEDAKKIRAAKWIMKLRAIAEHPATNEAEAANAAARAAQLLLDYDLSEHELDPEAFKKNPFAKQDTNYGSAANWRFDLACEVGRVFYVKCYRFRRRKGQVSGRGVLIGTEEHLAIFEYIYTYLVREIEKLAKTGWEVDGKRQRWMYGTSKLRWTNGFCHGAAATIANRLADWQRNGFRDNNTRGLMVLQDAQLNEAAGKFMGQVKPMQQSRAGFGDLAAQQAGRDAGWKVNFHQGIKSEQPQGYLE